MNKAIIIVEAIFKLLGIIILIYLILKTRKLLKQIKSTNNHGK